MKEEGRRKNVKSLPLPVFAVVLVFLSGCAHEAPSAEQQADAAQRQCAARMYAARQPHSAVNWSVYDYCMKTVSREQ